MYNDWNSIDDIGHYLVHPDMNRSKMFLSEMIRRDLLSDKWVKEWYSHDTLWLERWRKLDYDNQIQMIIDIGFGPLSMTKDPTSSARKFCSTADEDDKWDYLDMAAAYMTYYRASLPQWKDQATIQHWALLHSCQMMTTFIWDLVHLIDPEGSYYVVWDTAHAYIRKENTNTVYDILWYSVGIPIFELEENLSKAVRYENPVDFLIDVYFKKEEEKDILKYYMSL